MSFSKLSPKKKCIYTRYLKHKKNLQNQTKKTTTPAETPNNNTSLFITTNSISPSYDHNRAKFPHLFGFHHQLILSLLEKTPKPAKKLESKNRLPISNKKGSANQTPKTNH